MASANASRGYRRQSLQWGLLCSLLFILMVGSTPVCAAADDGSDGTLLDTLHDKGVVSDEEYEQLKKRDDKLDKVLNFLGGLELGTLSYIDFSGGEEKDGRSYNRFTITRGYINVKKKLTPWLGFRVTPDVTLDTSGDLKLRLKYLYGEFRPPNLGFLTDIKSEVGLGHMPWLDFEEHINPYRVQGTMFIERASIFNSADLGLSVQGNFGGQLGSEYQKTVSKAYAGRWGSWHLGVYNGGGYHAGEDNGNKVPEWRVTVRPLPDMLPGLQAHYFGLYGEGNKETVDDYPTYRVNLGMLSYQNAWIIFTGQYARTTGNNSGSLVVPGTDRGLRGEGYSFFFNTKLPVLERKLNWFARYDHFDPDRNDWVASGDDSYDLVNSGLAWDFFRDWMVILVYERVMYGDNSGGIGKAPVPGNNLDDDWRVQTALQIEF